MDVDKIVSLECPDYPGYIIAHSDIEYVELHEEHNVVSRLIFDLRDVECRIITYSYWNTVPYIVLQLSDEQLALFNKLMEEVESRPCGIFYSPIQNKELWVDVSNASFIRYTTGKPISLDNLIKKTMRVDIKLHARRVDEEFTEHGDGDFRLVFEALADVKIKGRPKKIPKKILAELDSEEELDFLREL